MAGQRGEDLKAECYPISIFPPTSRLFLDFTERQDPLVPFYQSSAYSTDWMVAPAILPAKERVALCNALEQSIQGSPERPAKIEQNLSRLRGGAGAVVTGQQVTLFGGPLFTLLKAATAIRRAKDASASGRPHVPIFWLATEDHDFAEAADVTFPANGELKTLALTQDERAGRPVGGIELGGQVEELLSQAKKILGPCEVMDDLVRCYRPGATIGAAFAAFLSRVFEDYGLIVLDASSRAFHALGRHVLREAIVRAGELHTALLDRDEQLHAAGYHSQVLVPSNSSLLFLIDSVSGARLALRRNGERWQAGKQLYSAAELLAILDSEPERLSPNALLRPVFQDAILPTAAYIGGPAEIGYFAQSQVLYERILGRTTPVLPRLSATLIDRSIAVLLEQHQISVPEIVDAALLDPQELAHQLAARSMPADAKQKLASMGDTLETELANLTLYMRALDDGLGDASEAAASKMRYQMNRLRRLAANHHLQREESLRRHAQAMLLSIFPDRHPQERKIGAAWFLARYGAQLPETLVEYAGQQCPGHRAIWL